MPEKSFQQNVSEIIRQETDNGRTIIEFLESMKNGEIEGAELADRVEAELMLAEMWKRKEDFNWPAAPAAE